MTITGRVRFKFQTGNTQRLQPPDVLAGHNRHRQLRCDRVRPQQPERHVAPHRVPGEHRILIPARVRHDAFAGTPTFGSPANAFFWRRKSTPLTQPVPIRLLSLASICGTAPASSVWTRTRTKNDEGHTFPFTDALERVLEAQSAEHERLKAEGVICPWVFNRSNRKLKGKRITTFIKAFRAACTRRAVRSDTT